jgi:hypothetical protein
VTERGRRRASELAGSPHRAPDGNGFLSSRGAHETFRILVLWEHDECTLPSGKRLCIFKLALKNCIKKKLALELPKIGIFGKLLRFRIQNLGTGISQHFQTNLIPQQADWH